MSPANRKRRSRCPPAAVRIIRSGPPTARASCSRTRPSDAVELWIGDASNGSVHRLGNFRLNPMFGSDVAWLADQKSLLVKTGSGRSRRAAGRHERAVRSRHPGIRRQHRREQHLRSARHAHQQARRRPVRLLRRIATRHRRCRHGQREAHRQTRNLRRRECIAGRPARDGRIDQAAVFVRGDLRAIPERCRRVRSRARHAESHRVDSADRSRSRARRAGRSARFRMARDRTRHADLGRGARQGRLESHRSESRQGDDAARAVQRKAAGNRAHAAAFRRLLVDGRSENRVHHRHRSEPALAPHRDHQRRRSETETARAVGSVERRALQESRFVRVSRAAERRVRRAAGRRRRFICAGRVRRRRAIVRSSIA